MLTEPPPAPDRVPLLLRLILLFSQPAAGVMLLEDKGTPDEKMTLPLASLMDNPRESILAAVMLFASIRSALINPPVILSALSVEILAEVMLAS